MYKEILENMLFEVKGQLQFMFEMNLWLVDVAGSTATIHYVIYLR
jgi:hypothetical protein